MLNNLEWLKTGAEFPPINERARLNRYAENKRIFDNRHMEAYNEQWRRIEKVTGSTAEVISYPVVLNYQKKISLKTADFLFQEPPEFSDNVKNIAEKSELTSIGYQGAIDVSRYGTAVYKVDIEDGCGRINISSPEFLYTVVSEADRKKVRHYVLAWVSEAADSRGRAKSYLSAYVHSKGSYTKMVFEIKDGVIGKQVLEEKDVPTGLSDFAVVPVHNVVTSDSVYGTDDYMDVDSIVAELEVRTAQISKILDTHANPTLSGSQNALTYDKRTGEYYFDAGNFYARATQEEPPLEYITWEANLDANFKQVKQLLNYLSTISEMGAAVLDSDLRSGNVPSGEALKRLYINVLAKVARVRNSFDTGLRKALALASEAGAKKAEAGEINIWWKDGIPDGAI